MLGEEVALKIQVHEDLDVLSKTQVKQGKRGIIIIFLFDLVVKCSSTLSIPSPLIPQHSPTPCIAPFS